MKTLTINCKIMFPHLGETLLQRSNVHNMYIAEGIFQYALISPLQHMVASSHISMHMGYSAQSDVYYVNFKLKGQRDTIFPCVKSDSQCILAL